MRCSKQNDDAATLSNEEEGNVARVCRPASGRTAEVRRGVCGESVSELELPWYVK